MSAASSKIRRAWRRLLSELIFITASYLRSVFLLLFLTGSFVVYAANTYPHGGSWIGVTYGVLGLLIILLLTYYGIRKRCYTAASPPLETWLRSHISLGVLVVFVIFFHSGFRLHDKVAVSALALMIAVSVSGVVGAVLYAAVPPRLIHVESNVTVTDISDKINHVAEAMVRLASNKSAAFQRLCNAVIDAERPASFAGWQLLRPGYLKNRLARNELKSLFGSQHDIAATEQSDLTRLLELSLQMRDLHDNLLRKQRYVNLMTAWLYVHVPLALALLVIVILHIVAAVYYW